MKKKNLNNSSGGLTPPQGVEGALSRPRGRKLRGKKALQAREFVTPGLKMSLVDSLLKNGVLQPCKEWERAVREMDLLELVEKMESDERYYFYIDLRKSALVCIHIKERHIAQQLLETGVISGNFIYLETPEGCDIYYRMPEEEPFFKLELECYSGPASLHLGISTELRGEGVTFYKKGFKVPQEIQEQQNKLESRESLESLSELPLHFWPSVMDFVPTPYDDDDEVYKVLVGSGESFFHRVGDRDWAGMKNMEQCEIGSEKWVYKAQEDIIKHLSLCSYNHYKANGKKKLSQTQLQELAHQINKYGCKSMLNHHVVESIASLVYWWADEGARFAPFFDPIFDSDAD